MIQKTFMVYGALVCLIFAYATHTGWSLTDAISSGKWGPQGHSAYHK